MFTLEKGAEKDVILTGPVDRMREVITVFSAMNQPYDVIPGEGTTSLITSQQSLDDILTVLPKALREELKRSVAKTTKGNALA